VNAAREAHRRGALRLEGGAVTGDAAVVAELAAAAAREVALPEPGAAAKEALTPALGSGGAPGERGAGDGRSLELGLRLRRFHDYAGATKQLELALQRSLPSDAPARRARVRLELARTLRLAGSRLDEAALRAADAESIASAHGLAALAVEAALERALARYLERRYEEALRALDEATAELAAAGSATAEATPLERASAPADAAPRTPSLPERRHLEGEIEHARGIILAHLDGEANARAAAEAFRAALRLAAGAADADLFARACQSAGEARRRAGDLAAAEGFLSVAARYKERLGDLAGLAIAYGGLARLARERRDRAAALDWFRRDLSIALTIGDHRGAGVAANSAGELEEERFLEARDPAALARAGQLFEASRAAASRSQNPLDEAIAAFYSGRFRCRARGDLPGGIAELERSRAILRTLGKPELVAKVDAALGDARARHLGR
jgi:hypothetical protein